MGRPILKAYIQFGLVTIPVGLFTLQDPQDLSFRLLHKVCLKPIENRRWCPTHEKMIPFEDTVRAFEFTKERFVPLTEEELSRDIESAKGIRIERFVALSEIDPVHFEKAYLTAPEEVGRKAYRLLVTALRASKKAALGTMVMRSKQHVALLRTVGNQIVLHTLLLPAEIREAEGLDFGEDLEVNPQEQKMALSLIKTMTASANLGQFKDDWREKILAVVKAKVAGEPIAPEMAPVPKVVPTDNLVESLRASMKVARRKPEPTLKREKAEAR